MLPFESCGDVTPVDPFEITIIDLIRRGNLPQAEILVRMHLTRFGPNAKTLNYLGWVAAQVGLLEPSMNYFKQAAQLSPTWGLPGINLERVRLYVEDMRHAAPRGPAVQGRHAAQGQHAAQGRSAARGKPTAGLLASNRFLLVKAWGFGFWSDVSHVIGQLLIAELTGRIPIVHWGANSLFWDGATPNAFDAFFEPVSAAGLDDLRDEKLRIWPPKWSRDNLLQGEVNQWKGPYSRIPGLYLLKREEEIVVSDFFTSVFDLRPWISDGSPLYGLSIDEICSHLLHKYLRPRSEIIDAVESFHAARLASEEFIAVHVRGSDKALEVRNLQLFDAEYHRLIDDVRTRHGVRKIFLLTDDARILALYSSRYGEDVISTDCQRTDTPRGVHYDTTRNRVELGKEVMVDAYLATRGKAFIGNAISNPSLMIRCLKSWPEHSVHLIGPNMFHQPNTFLHAW
jgi:hypothetical protein